jgi:hypothetical protein
LAAGTSPPAERHSGNIQATDASIFVLDAAAVLQRSSCYNFSTIIFSKEYTMNKTRLRIVLAVLIVLAATESACSTLNAVSAPVGLSDSISDFPLPGHVRDFTKLSDEMTTFGTDMSMKDLLAFYRDALSKKGYTERTQLTLSNETDFGVVFDGHAGGKEFIAQGSILPDGSSTVTLRLRDIDN